MPDFINQSALEPLFKPWEEPNSHRVRADRAGDPARIVKGRRASPLVLAHNIRGAVREWREAFYAGASDTSRYLLDHWFNRSHRKTTPASEEIDFQYYFCQREAIETLIYLNEVRQLNSLSALIAEFGGADKEIAALGITEEEDAWSRYAFKLATGAGKTKVMSLAIVWSYFHSLRESESKMARHFVLIAPGLTVYERLKDDFRPGDGRPDIFDSDPLIPPEWRGDWNLSVVLQDEAAGAATGGVLYLTNIHRLHDPGKRTRKAQSETYTWTGPPVSKASALDTAAALRDRIGKHPCVMVINDEAHHVWDPDSAWNEAIQFIHENNRQRGGAGLVSQLDFSATPKDDKGQVFKHVVCDTPLGEAVDGGIVKTPVIGSADRRLEEQPGDNAAYIYEKHLLLGYERWKLSRDEWQKSGKKPLLFVMCNSTNEADQIAKRLNRDELFKDLNGNTINLHTNLKGKLKTVGRGLSARKVFEESESDISDKDLIELRKLSRELDSDTSPYRCIVSVLMLREGWDVRNVTTVVPLRPLIAQAGILPEQTLGRGLRRMTPPGQANEIVTVIEHPAFAKLYAEELAQEGLPIEVAEIDRIPATTISIYADKVNKNVNELEIEVPRLSGGYSIQATISGLTLKDVRKEFEKYSPLPLGGLGNSEIQYEGRHLLTNEIVERLKIHLPLLESGVGAVSYFVKQLEQICKLRGTHAILAPLMQTFLEEILFERKTTLYDQALITRLADSDVAEHIRAVFVPLIRARTTTSEKRLAESAPIALSSWKPYQVTHSENRPVRPATHTLFNLVPCNRELELAVAAFLDERAKDVAAFAKNAGPQCLRIDYLASGARLAFYTPDFFVRTKDGNCYLIETKGREDRDVPRKAKAAIAWCEAASTPECRWKYVYLPQGVFERLTGDTVAELARTCEPSLLTLIESEDASLQMPLFAAAAAAEAATEEKAPELAGIVDEATLQALPPRYRKAAEQATMLYRFFENKEGMNYSPIFTALLGSLDEAAKGLVVRRLQPLMPVNVPDQKLWFDPYLQDADHRMLSHYQKMANNLKRTLVFSNGIMPMGLLRDCMEYALNDTTKLDGVFRAVKTKFKVAGGRELLSVVTKIYDFRNTRIAHVEKEISDPKEAERNLIGWIGGLKSLIEAQS
jgi:type III restriction enzyme